MYSERLLASSRECHCQPFLHSQAVVPLLTVLHEPYLLSANQAFTRLKTTSVTAAARIAVNQHHNIREHDSGEQACFALANLIQLTPWKTNATAKQKSNADRRN